MNKAIKIIVTISIIILVSLLTFHLFKTYVSNPTETNSTTENKEYSTNRFAKSQPQISNETDKPSKTHVDIIFLHHSTGEAVWDGGVPSMLEEYNQKHNTQYVIKEMEFPTDEYGWENFPYDYWNIWVKHGDLDYYQGQPTLKTLTKNYDVIIFKHCFPVGDIQPDDGSGDITSSDKTLANYKLQYNALKQTMHKFKDTKFIVWTGAALVRESTTPEQVQLHKEFVDWVKNSWDESDDNIYIFDFYTLETEGDLYMKDEYSLGGGDSHPNAKFSRKAAKAFVDRIIEVIQS